MGSNAVYPQAFGSFFQLFSAQVLSGTSGARTATMDLGSGEFNEPGADGILLRTDYTKGDETSMSISIELSHDGTTYYAAPQLTKTLVGAGAKVEFYHNVEPFIRQFKKAKIIIAPTGGNTGTVSMWARVFGVQPCPIKLTYN